MTRTRYKKQFRLYDIYRYAATGIQSKIHGIKSYEANRTATTIAICFSDRIHNTWYFADNEQELKEIVKQVNKRLGNCDTPGPKAGGKR